VRSPCIRGKLKRNESQVIISHWKRPICILKTHFQCYSMLFHKHCSLRRHGQEVQALPIYEMQQEPQNNCKNSMKKTSICGWLKLLGFPTCSCERVLIMIFNVCHPSGPTLKFPLGLDSCILENNKISGFLNRSGQYLSTCH
jgi:hypothetical protein